MTTAPSVNRVVYDQWRGGFRSKVKTIGANTKQYSSMNMQVYDNGNLGVRPWMKIQDDTNITASTTLDDNCYLTPRYNSGQAGELYLVHHDTGKVFAYDYALGWQRKSAFEAITGNVEDDRADYYGTRNNWTGSPAARTLVGSAQYSIMPDNDFILGGEAHQTTAGTTSTITWTDATDDITNFVLYRDRIWGWVNVGASTDPSNRLFYTDAASYTVSAAGNYLDIGAASDDYYILGAWPLSDSLLICMSDGGWWVFTGTPDAGSLRFIGNYPSPSHGAAGAVLGNIVYFLAPNGRQVCMATPSGVETNALRDIRPWTFDRNHNTFIEYRGISSHREQAIMLPVRAGNSKYWDTIELVNGDWGVHSYGRADFTTNTANNMGYLRDVAPTVRDTVFAYLVEDPDETKEAQLFTRDIVLNRPSHSSDTYSDYIETTATAPSTITSKGAVRLASYAPEGEECRVRQVTVDFHYWKTDVATYYAPADMECRVRHGDIVTQESIDTFDNSVLPSLVDKGFDVDWQQGLSYRWIFRFPLEDADFAMTSQVELDNILSVAIDRIIVDYEVRPDNHWGGQMAGT